MNATAGLTPFEILARYERLSLEHASDTRERMDAPGLWRGIGYRVGPRMLVSEIGEINELLAMPPLTAVPGTRPWLLGVANVRGNLMPVVDFGRFLFDERNLTTSLALLPLAPVGYWLGLKLLMKATRCSIIAPAAAGADHRAPEAGRHPQCPGP